MRKISAIVFILALMSMLAGCTVFKVSVGDEIQPLTERVISGEGRDKILLLDISGVISSEENDPLLGGKKSPGLLARVREELDRARSDKKVKALVLRINSPGGGVTASDMLYHEIKAFKKDTGVKVLAHFMDTGASGAYYAALAADRITAQPTSVIGGIGVIMFRIDATGLMQKIGVQTYEIASGEKKGMGSPFRTLSPEERSIFQGVVDSLQKQFVNAVIEGRSLTPDIVNKVADGRIYTSQESKAWGLIDDICYLDDAVYQVKKLAGLEQATVVTYFRPGDYRANLYSMNLISINMGEMMQPGVSFMYLWWP